MLTPKNLFSKDEMRLLKHFRQLDAADKNSVTAFAAFLGSEQNSQENVSATDEQSVSTTPLGLPKPETETVIGAIKRLSKNYPMIEKGTMLDETSSLMSGHLLQGRAASEVIDDLELLFKKHYKIYKNNAL